MQLCRTYPLCGDEGRSLTPGLEAVVAGVTTSAGWYVSINDVMGLAFIGWLISVGIAMMRLKPKAVVLALQERELQGAG